MWEEVWKVCWDVKEGVGKYERRCGGEVWRLGECVWWGVR